MLTALIASAACDDGWKNEVTITARATIDEGVASPTQVEVNVLQWKSITHGDTDFRSVPAEIAIGGTATDLMLAANGVGTFVPPPSAIDELHVQIDGVHLSQPMPRLIVEQTTTSPGALATVLVTSEAGDSVNVILDNQVNDCWTTSDGIRFEVLPGCVPSPGRYGITVSSSRAPREPSVDLEDTFGGTAYLTWRLKQIVHLNIDIQ